MSDFVVPVGDDELRRIGEYVKGNLYGWLSEVAPQVIVGPQLLERMTRVEEELKAQRELMAARFDATDQRFADMNTRFEDVNTRFEDVNTRFDDVNKRFDDINKRFDDVNKRFGSMQWLIGVGLLLVTALMSVYEFIT